MKNEIYEADYRRREERSEFPNAFDDAVMTGFFKAYGDIMRSIPKMIVPQDKKNYEELLLKLDALAKRRHGSIRGVVSYERWDSHIYVTLPFLSFLIKRNTSSLLNWNPRLIVLLSQLLKTG